MWFVVCVSGLLRGHDGHVCRTSIVQTPDVRRAQVLADMKPSFTRTPSSFRDGLEGQGIAMPFARGQIVASCEFLKQFDSQAKCVPFPANARCLHHSLMRRLALCTWRGIDSFAAQTKATGVDEQHWRGEQSVLEGR